VPSMVFPHFIQSCSTSAPSCGILELLHFDDNFCDTRWHDLVPTCSTCHTSQPTVHQVSVSAATSSIVVLQVFRGFCRLVWYCFWRQQEGYSHLTVTHAPYNVRYAILQYGLLLTTILIHSVLLWLFQKAPQPPPPFHGTTIGQLRQYQASRPP
jgi:hypothetical protein